MKLIVNENEYDITDALQGASLGDLMKLKVKTKGAQIVGDPAFLGVTVRGIQDTFESVGQRMQDDDFNAVELLGDELFLVHMAGLIYLARRQNHEICEVTDALDTAFNDFRMVADEDDETAVEDNPKVTDSAAAENDAAV